jgi:hypothetical protein
MAVGPADIYVYSHSGTESHLRRYTEKNNRFTLAHDFSDEPQVSHVKCDVAFEREMLWISHAMNIVQKQGHLTQSFCEHLHKHRDTMESMRNFFLLRKGLKVK